MTDQAFVLRGLIEKQQGTARARTPSAAPRATTISITSGKGGVGKSHIALNLAVALAQLDRRVCLLDANLGLGNIELLCGLNGYWNLSHVVTGARRLPEIVLEGPAGIHVVPGAHGIVDAADCPANVQNEIIGQLSELERDHDFLIVDTATGIHRTVRSFLTAADVVLVITTPEPTAIADAYATVKTLCGTQGLRIELIVNQAHSTQQAAAVAERVQCTTRLFLRTEVEFAGWIPNDPRVAEAVAARVPFVLAQPNSPASESIKKLARRLRQTATHSPPTESYFSRLWQSVTARVA